jgi:hypothetical protein
MLFAAALLAVLPAATGSHANFDFRGGSLEHWSGQGFYLTPATGRGPSASFAVCSSDCGPRGRKAILHRTFVVPPDAGAIRFRAAAVRGRDCDADGRLDVVLETTGRRFIPKQVRSSGGPQAGGWTAAPRLLPLAAGQPHEYQWDVSDLAGQTARIAIRDDDDRPGCHVFCGGFRFVSRDEINGRAFADRMRQLAREHQLAPMTRLDSRHFMAIGNADDLLIEECLYHCETIYPIFLDHFRRKGFTVREPNGRLMVAVFDTQAGFEAYVGRSLGPAVRGIFHTPTNRLVVYDYGHNREFLDSKARAEREARAIANGPERQRVLNSFNRRAYDIRTDANISTVMHEVAHQLSFNCGLMNRDADAPLWLVEGLACYCESASSGGWQGIGEPNPSRAAALATVLKQKGSFLPLRQLIESDDWLRKASSTREVVTGYAQSWALFSLLMEERPGEMKKYLSLVATRRAPEQRLADFTQAFGTDLAGLEKNYRAYLRDMAATARLEK